ncbi:MAG TPA: hypothetical protein VFB82_09485, partial [Blastocatellia bacterium]|nr:hypothetical protein [Blastocatellia bacterium]
MQSASPDGASDWPVQDLPSGQIASFLIQASLDSPGCDKFAVMRMALRACSLLVTTVLAGGAQSRAQTIPPAEPARENALLAAQQNERII